MKYILYALALLPFLALSQTDKGASPLPTAGDRPPSAETYAVVVGISDYQDEGIPDLRFADKDAEAFANFLRSPAGGSLDEDHLKLLTNSQATTAQFDAALSWLLDESKEGDQTIIYFSGHGDVELRTRSQQGFLLCWDSPSKGYVAGAYPVFFMKEIIATLSLDNKAKVLVVTDACRSGKLAGSEIGGQQLTSQNLAQQYANEIKILSCQPNEYSIEGEQWGGGRGAFSYYLVDGLYGMADRNSDQAVSLSEMNRYLEDHVTPEVAPQNQLPMTIGNGRETLFSVVPELLAQVEKSRQGQMPSFAPTESRGMEDDVLATLDEPTRELYQRFKTALKERTFLSAPLGEAQVSCADAYYTELMKEPKLERLHNTMRRNYAASLQDEAQQVLNKILNNDVEEISLSKISQAEKYRLYPGYLQRAAELLGEDHYMYPVLQARKLYFEGYLLHIENETPDRELGEQALAKYRAALALQPDFPHPYHSMSAVYFWQLLELDSAEYYTEQAVRLAPSWFVPYSALATMYGRTRNSIYFDKIKYYLEQADRVDSTSSQTNLWHMLQWGEYYLRTRQFILSEKQFKKVIALDDNFAKGHSGLGVVYHQSNRLKEAKEQLIKSIALDSTDLKSVGNLGLIYQHEGRYAEAELQYKKALQMDTTNHVLYTLLAGIYNLIGRYAEADSHFDKVFQLDSTTILNYNIAIASYMNAGRYHKAETILLKGLQLDSNNYYFNIGLAQVYHMRGRYEKCETILLKGLQLDSNNVNFRNMLGWIYFKNNQIEKAEEQMLEVLRIDSLNNEGLICLAILMGQTERYKQGEAIALKSVKLYPFDPHGPNTLGLIYAKSGRYAEAEQQLNKSLEMRPDDNNNAPSALLHYAVLYSLQNNIDKAFDYLEQVGQMEHLTPYFYIDLKAEPALAPLRAQTERWDALMKKYFHEQTKN